MTAPLAIESPVVLANKGVVVNTIKVVPGESGVTPTDPPEYERREVRITNRVMADIEETWGTYDAWNQALNVQTFKTVLRTLALIWNEPANDVADMLIEGQIEQYQLALLVSAFRANGVPVDDLGKLLARGLEESEKNRALIRERMMTAFDKPGEETTRTEKPSSDSSLSDPEVEMEPLSEEPPHSEFEPVPGMRELQGATPGLGG